jgi:hypothetical protein
VGRIFKPDSPIAPMVGDLVCWNRTAIPGDWRGHVGIVSRVGELGLWYYIAGNEGRTGEVKERIGKYARLWRFASVAP